MLGQFQAAFVSGSLHLLNCLGAVRSVMGWRVGEMESVAVSLDARPRRKR